MTRNVPVGHPDFGKAFPCVCQQEAMAQRHKHRLLKVSNLDNYSHFRFDNFETDAPGYSDEHLAGLRVSLKMASDYARNPDGWLLIRGGYGCGKTHLAAAVGNYQLQRGNEVIFVTVPDLLDHLRATFNPASDVSYDELFNKVRNVPLLILDDLGTESGSPWAIEKLFQLLDHRYIKRLHTVITTNHDLLEIDGRVRSRLQDGRLVFGLHMTLPDFRRGDEQKQSTLSNLSLYRDMTFSTFHTGSHEFQADVQASLHTALREAQYFADEPEGWLLFYGGHGCGKTHLAAAIANHCLHAGRPIVFVTVADLLDHLRSAFDKSNRESLDSRFREVREAPLLILDDLNLKTASTWAQEKLFQILDYRYLAQQPTVITMYKGHLAYLLEQESRLLSRLSDRRICTQIEIIAPEFARRKWVRRHS